MIMVTNHKKEKCAKTHAMGVQNHQPQKGEMRENTCDGRSKTLCVKKEKCVRALKMCVKSQNGDF